MRTIFQFKHWRINSRKTDVIDPLRSEKITAVCLLMVCHVNRYPKCQYMLSSSTQPPRLRWINQTVHTELISTSNINLVRFPAKITVQFAPSQYLRGLRNFQAVELHSEETRMKKSKRFGSSKFSLRLRKALLRVRIFLPPS